VGLAQVRVCRGRCPPPAPQPVAAASSPSKPRPPSAPTDRRSPGGAAATPRRARAARPSPCRPRLHTQGALAELPGRALADPPLPALSAPRRRPSPSRVAAAWSVAVTAAQVSGCGRWRPGLRGPRPPRPNPDLGRPGGWWWRVVVPVAGPGGCRLRAPSSPLVARRGALAGGVAVPWVGPHPDHRPPGSPLRGSLWRPPWWEATRPAGPER